MSFIFGGDTGLSYDQIQSRRKMAEAMMNKGGTPRNIGEGINSFASSISGALMQRRLDKADKANEAKSDELWGSMWGMGAPNVSTSGTPSPFDAMAANGGPTNAAADVMDGLPPSIVQSESGGNWGALNSEGYGGRGQFGAERLADAARAGVVPAGMTGEQYSRAPQQVQLAVENWHKNDILGDLGQYVGADVDGAGPIPPLTEDSILAVAHLGGTGGARKFVESGGRYNPSDSNGTSLADYAMRHAGGQATMSARGGPSQGGGGPGLQQIAQALSDPYIRRDPGKVAVLQALLQREMAPGMNPLQQVQLEREQFELGQLQNPTPDPRSVELTNEEEEALGLPTGGVYQRQPDGTLKTIYEPEAGAGEPAGIQSLRIRAQEAGLVPGTPEYQQFMLDQGNSSGMAIDVGPDGTVSIREGAGAGSAKPFTEAQSKSVIYATRAEGALDILDPIAANLTNRGQGAMEAVPFGLARGFQDEDFQVAKAAGDEFLQAILRKDTGAAITEGEQALYGVTYLPQPGDGPEVLQHKAGARRRAIEALKAGMSPAEIVAKERALEATGTANSQPTATPSNPNPEQFSDEQWQQIWDAMSDEDKAVFQ